MRYLNCSWTHGSSTLLSHYSSFHLILKWFTNSVSNQFKIIDPTHFRKSFVVVVVVVGVDDLIKTCNVLGPLLLMRRRVSHRVVGYLPVLRTSLCHPSSMFYDNRTVWNRDLISDLRGEEGGSSVCSYPSSVAVVRMSEKCAISRREG